MAASEKPLVLLVVAMLALAARPAAAQEQVPADARSNDPDAVDQQGKLHYRRGIIHFNVGEFEEAIGEFQEAYSLTNTPAMLFNIAQAYRALKDYERSIAFYKAYLDRSPGSPDRTYIEARIRDVEEARARLGEAPGSQPVEHGSPPPPANVVEPTPTIEAHPGRVKQLAGLVTAGSGAVLLATALYFAHEASVANAEVDGLFSGGATWNRHFADVYDRGRRADEAALILAGVGTAAVVCGGVLYYLGWRESARMPAVSVVPTGARAPDGAALEITFAF